MKSAAADTLLIAAAVLASGCAAHLTARGSQPDQAATQALAAWPRPDGGIDAAEPSMRNDLMHAIDGLKNVTFDLNSAILSSEARVILKGNAQWLKEHPDTRVQVAGNCDQRGTAEYNLALGQRRAKAVREYYGMLGVAGGRVATISYGKEKPMCQEQTEECWQRNRRAETLGAYERVVGKLSR